MSITCYSKQPKEEKKKRKYSNIQEQEYTGINYDAFIK